MTLDEVATDLTCLGGADMPVIAETGMYSHKSRQMALDGLLDPVVGWVPTATIAWLCRAQRDSCQRSKQ